MTDSSDDVVREHLVAAIDAELGDRLRPPSGPPIVRQAAGRDGRRWLPALAAAVVVAAIAGVAVFVASRDDSTAPTLSGGSGLRVTCTAPFGVAEPDRDRLVQRASAIADDASVQIDGSTAVITVPGASADDVADLCASAPFTLRPLIAPPVAEQDPDGTSSTPITLPSSEDEYLRLTADERAAITHAMSQLTNCPDAADGSPVTACFDCECNVRSALVGPAIVTQADIAGAEAIAPSAAAGLTSWTVAVTLDESGGQALYHYTVDHHTDGEPGSPGSCGPAGTPCSDFLATVLDGHIVSLPVTLAPIAGDHVQISGEFTEQSAQDLAARLADALPVLLQTVTVHPY